MERKWQAIGMAGSMFAGEVLGLNFIGDVNGILLGGTVAAVISALVLTTRQGGTEK